MARKLSFLLVGLVALLVAACGGGGAGGEGAASSVSLSETYNSDGITLKYPAGWVIQGAAAPGGPIILANNQAALDAAQAADNTTRVAAGQQFIFVIPFVGDSFQAMSTVISSPVDLLSQMGPSITESGMAFGDPVEATIGGKPAARSSASGDEGDAQIIAINLGDTGYVMVMGAAGKGEMGGLEGTLNAVAESVNVAAS